MARQEVSGVEEKRYLTAFRRIYASPSPDHPPSSAVNDPYLIGVMLPVDYDLVTQAADRSQTAA